MNFFLYLLNVTCSAGQSALGKQYAKSGGASLPFNVNKAAIGTVMFLAFALIKGFSLHASTMFFGVCYGISLSISMHTGFKALSIGPMSLTSIIASFSLIIPFLFGIVFWEEEFNWLKLVGIIFLLTSILLINIKREKGFSVKWFLYAMATLITNGICSVIQKLHQREFPSLYQDEFMFWALLCVLSVLLVTYSLKEHKTQKLKISFLGIVSGIANCVANYVVLYLSVTENASVLFPVISILNIIAVWAIGILVFKEKLKLLQAVGLIIGVVSVVLLKL